MPFYKVTYSDKYRRATVHNYGCNMRCEGWSYQLLRRPKPERFLSVSEIEQTLAQLQPQFVHFMGGEPTTCPDLPELLRFCKQELGVTTRLGHTNGTRLPLDDLDGANVSFKAFDDDLCLSYTGRPARPILDNFARAFDAGLELKGSIVFIPERIGIDQVERVAQFIAGLDPGIPFHLMGYIPVPGKPWRRPTESEMQQALAAARAHLHTVTFSHLTPEEVLTTASRDDRFDTRRVL